MPGVRNPHRPPYSFYINELDSSERADEADGDGCPWRIGDHLLAAAGARRQDQQLAGFAPDQSAEQETSGGPWHQHIAVERGSISIG